MWLLVNYGTFKSQLDVAGVLGIAGDGKKPAELFLAAKSHLEMLEVASMRNCVKTAVAVITTNIYFDSCCCSGLSERLFWDVAAWQRSNRSWSHGWL